MFGLEFPVDPRLQATINRRRLMEEDRKSRILDEKTRRIGIDVEGLNRQIQDKSKVVTMEKSQNEEIEKEMLRRDQLAVQAEECERQRRRKSYQAIDHFRLVCQRPDTQRDFDLNDPERLKKARPPRGLFDQDCGPASLQKFDGEDMEKAERDKEKKEIQKVWLEQQRQEQLALQKRMIAENERLDTHVSRLAQMAIEESQFVDDHRRRMETAIQEYNLQLTENKKAQERLLKQHEMERNMLDMECHIFSDILAEDPAVAHTSLHGVHRIIPDRWKGMTSDEVDKIFRSQREQIVEKRANETNRKRDNEAWDCKILGDNRAQLLRERQRCRAVRDHERTIMEENRRLAEEQRSLQEHLNRNVYRGVTSEEFFSHFGNSCR